MADTRRRKPARQGQDISARLQQRIAEGDFYEALQLYKTSYARFKAQEKLDEAEQLITDGAAAMARRKELNAATELGVLLVESFEENSRPVQEKYLKQLQSVADAWPCPGIELVAFLKSAVAWAGGSAELAAKDLRVRLARAYLVTDDYGGAARNFATAGAGAVAEYATVLRDWSRMGYKSERDLFLCRAVLHVLSLNRASEAVELFARGATAMSEPEDSASPVAPSDGIDAAADATAAEAANGTAKAGGGAAGPAAAAATNQPAWLTSPLCNFTRFLLELVAVRGKARVATPVQAQAFVQLRDSYAPALARDPHLQQLVGRVAEVHFGVKAPAAGGMLGNLMQMMMQG